jgi:CelD/BcsL family acetyltransferase involved in cellulose biosynthesis
MERDEPVLELGEIPLPHPNARRTQRASLAPRAAAANVVRHWRKFRGGRIQVFLGENLLGLATHNQLRIFTLEVAGKVVASRLAFRFDGALYLYFADYDAA